MKLHIRKGWLLAAAIAAMPLLAADSLNVKTGTWETTMTTKTSGMEMAMPASAMANMTPEQKAQMAAMMSRMGAGGAAPKPVTEKSCVTEKDLRDGAFRAQQQKDSKCTYKPVVSSGKHQEMTFECPGEQGVSSGRMVVDALDNSNIKGEMHLKAGGMTIDSTFTSKWLGPTCAAEDK